MERRSLDRDKEIERLKAEIERLKSLAYRDELTGLYNRRGFKDSAEKFISELASEKKEGSKRKAVQLRNFSMVMFDIDDFKKLNDTYGHQAGDEALKKLSQSIMDNVRDIDSVARWGGEEILLGLVGASETDAFQIAERVRDNAENKPIKFEVEKIKLTVSAGVASMDEAKDAEELIKFADKALYAAKKAGKNQVVKYSELRK